ncbi:hypothetical protein DER46DRAFT_613791 [Fusarium sp. MPI-SDFR-AT-0072]|nr:hypothetical protein DER46DRAFT_613791 [Fusarium sp. MPI-SDFR-AT-0072]
MKSPGGSPSQHDLPIAPNMFLEVEGLDGAAAVTKRQITYDLELGTRGQLALRSYSGMQRVQSRAKSLTTPRASTPLRSSITK